MTQLALDFRPHRTCSLCGRVYLDGPTVHAEHCCDFCWLVAHGYKPAATPRSETDGFCEELSRWMHETPKAEQTRISKLAYEARGAEWNE